VNLDEKKAPSSEKCWAEAILSEKNPGCRGAIVSLFFGGLTIHLLNTHGFHPRCQGTGGWPRPRPRR